MGNVCAPKSNLDQEKGVSQKKPDSTKEKTPAPKVKVKNTSGEYRKKSPWTHSEQVIAKLKKKIKAGAPNPDDPKPEATTVPEKILACFDKLDKWEFPILDLSELTDGNPLVYMGYALLVRYDFFQKFNLEEADAIEFLTRIQSLYKDIPFHNATHAANTLHAFHYMIRRGLSSKLNDEDTFASFLAAMCVDIDHPGLDNYFQAIDESPIATLYNDLNILENHSATVLFQLIKEVDMFQKFPKDQRKGIREMVMEVILATDLEDSDEYAKAFKQRVDSGCGFQTRDELKNLLQVTLILSDLSHYMKGSRLYSQWSQMLCQERCNQGDLEMKKGYTVSRGYDRSNVKDMIKIDEEIMDKIISPLLKSYITVFGKLKFLKGALRKNETYWSHLDENGPLYSLPALAMQKAQDEFDQDQNSKIVPGDQDCVIPQDEQEEKRWKPTDELLSLESKLVSEVSTRFAEGKGRDFKKLGLNPKIYSILDFKDAPFKGLTADEKRDAVQTIFDRIDDWDFDVFTLSELLHTHAMFITASALFEKWGLFEKFKIPHEVFSNFVRSVQNGYQINPYHNAMHACDVMQITHSIIVKGRMDDVMDPLDCMAAILSSMVHDLDHPGLNNAYQSHSDSFLAYIYNNRSILENHHCAQTFALMRKDKKFDIFQNLKPEQKRDARKTMVAMIISTDMTNHGKYIKLFNGRIESGSDFKNKKDLRIALQIAIKMADVSNPSRPLYLYLQWTQKIIHEFFMQGDKERENNLPVSPLMDRHASVLSKGQIAFMDYVISPMFKSFTTVFPGMKFVLEVIAGNKGYWGNHMKIEEEDFRPVRNNEKGEKVEN